MNKENVKVVMKFWIMSKLSGTVEYIEDNLKEVCSNEKLPAEKRYFVLLLYLLFEVLLWYIVYFFMC